MNNLNKTYHKGKYRSGEWAKHLRPYLKKVSNKRWRKTGKNIAEEEIVRPVHTTIKLKKKIKVKITFQDHNGKTHSRINTYKTLRDAKNAMNQAHVIRTLIIEPKN